MKKIITLLLLLSFLTSCGGEIVKDDIEAKKTDFFVETQIGSEFSGNTFLEKTGQVTSSQDISLNANANGRVSIVYVKAGDTVKVGQPLAILEDNIGSYGINLQRASNGVERAKINYESSKINLDTQIFNTQSNLTKLTRNLETLKSDSKQNLLLVEDNLQNSKYDGLDSKSALQLEQLDNNIEKSKLDYDIKLVVDAESILGYQASVKKDFNALLILLDDIIEFSDKILGVSEKNKTENDKFERYLGAEDLGQKQQSRNALKDLIGYKNGNDFTHIEELFLLNNLTEEELIYSIDFISNGYEQTKSVLNNLEQTLNNSIASVNTLDKSQIQGYVSSINVYQGQFQGNYGAFISFGTGVKSFLRTYKTSQSSLLKAIDLQQKDREIQLKNLLSGELSAETSYERTVLSIDDTIQNLESQVKTAENNFESAKKTKEISLKSLQNAISEANISYKSALKEYSKLTITSPINGTISDVFLDKGQEVFSSSKLFSIVSDKTPELEISFSGEEKELVSQGQEVFLEILGKKIQGTIYAISEVADANLNYKATVVFESGTNIIGNLVTVHISIETDKMLVPINIVTTQGENIGTVKTLSGSNFETVRVRLGKVFGEYIEVISCAHDCETIEIITNDITNFDENKFIIIEK